MNIRYEWDKNKAKSNLRKHHVSFEIAARVFADPFAMVRQDRIENGEYRWQTLGLVDGFLLLLVAHTVHDDKEGIEVIRIISARRANSKERKRYEEESSL
ncbi:BrnT family toxin [Bartonella sp. 220]|uniref:BrnT family toxin n=1 Tax=Bartonella sp. 220B TaxID=2967260 RepID=UPI0022A9EE49|nr:BrnT family toxin [Bartonella sp. 220B]MCZ2159003.1 BrnT family toxin [Bartonella sp. 220B]